MRITTFLLCVGILSVSASVYSQDEKVSIRLKNRSVESVLAQTPASPNLDFTVYGNHIIIPPKGPFGSALKLQEFVVTGRVTDQNGEPLPDINIMIKGTTTGFISDVQGNYTISNVPNDAVLVFSFVGMKTQEVSVNEKTNVSVVMEEDAVGETVITALGFKREKKVLGYSVSEVKGDDLTETSQPNVLNALAGKVAGAKINQISGSIGASVNMIIRGAASLSIDNQPLFIIDGIPVQNQLNNLYQGADFGNAIFDINPDAIESISVLKGANAAALYGSRAGNGVVMITTRSGASGKKGIGVSFNSTNVWEVPFQYMPVQNKFASGKDGGIDIWDEMQNESWGVMLDAGRREIQWNSDGKPAPLVSYPDRFKDFFQTGFTTTNNLAVSGNYDKGFFRISGGDMRNTEIIPNTDLKRTSINLNAGFDVTKKFRVSGSFLWTQSSSDNRPNIDGGDRNGILRSLYEMSSHVNIMDLKDYWVKGQEGFKQKRYRENQNNVWFVAHENANAFTRDRLTTKVGAEWDLTDDLTLSGSFARDAFTGNREVKRAFSTYGLDKGAYGTMDMSHKETNMNMTLLYKKHFSEIWSLNAFVAANRMFARDEVSDNYANQLVIPNLYTIGNAVPGTVTRKDLWSEKVINSVYGMTSIGFKNRIYLDLTARNDWLSTLSSENRSNFYPSASLSILLSEMITMPEWLTYTKLRGGIAKVGVDNWGNNGWMYSGILMDKDLKLGMAISKEIGTDLRFSNNRIGLDLTYYNVQNKNQISIIKAPFETGTINRAINIGSIESRGWEIMLLTTPVQTRDFRWDMIFNFSRNRTKLKELVQGMDYYKFEDTQGAMFRSYAGDYIGNIYQQPMLKVTDKSSPYYGYPIIDNAGYYQIDNKPENIIKIGNSNPDFNLGIQPTFSYKGFTLYANIDWSQGGQFYSETMMFFSNNGWLDDTFSGAAYDPSKSIESQIKENPQAYFGEWIGGRTPAYGGFLWPSNPNRSHDACFNPGVRETSGVYTENLGVDGTIWITPFVANQKAVRQFPEKSLYSATYIKLREVALTYHFPTKLIEKISLQRLSLSLVATNIWKWTAADIFVDPERAYMPSNNKWASRLEYYNIMPYTGTIGLKLNVEF